MKLNISKRKINEVIDRLDGKELSTNKHLCIFFEKNRHWWYFSIHKDWYDGPFWSVWIGPIAICWSWYGLPYIFQERIK